MPATSPESTETSAESLFRPEALAHHRRASGSDPLEPLRIPGHRVAVAYRVVVALLVPALAALCLVQIDSRVRGAFIAHRAPGRTDAWQVSVRFGWRYRDALAPGRRIRLSDDAGCLDLVAPIARLDDRPSFDASFDPGARSQPAEPQVVVHAEVERPCAADERAGAAEATLDTAPLLAVLVPQLRGLLARLREAM